MKFITPIVIMAILGGLAIVEADRQGDVARVQAAFGVFDDPSVQHLAHDTAYVDTVRLRAPRISAGATSAELIHTAEAVCEDLGNGVASRNLPLRDAGYPATEVSALVNAAHLAYCSTLPLNGSRQVVILD